jgi:tetratricopeptide (TPR) repeat protein
MRTLRTDTENQANVIMDDAYEARNSGNLSLAMELCERALGVLVDTDTRPRANIHRELGFIYSLQKNWVRSEEHYRLAVELSPRYDLASMGLFLSLFHQNRLRDALLEAVRLLKLQDSRAYRELFEDGDGFRDDLESDDRALAEEARTLLRCHASKKNGSD